MSAKGIRVPISLFRADGTATVGAAMQVVARNIANAVTNEYAQNPADYDVDVVVTIHQREA